MDQIHEIDKKPWISKRKVCLRELVGRREQQFREGEVFSHDTLLSDEDDNDNNNEKLLDEFVKCNEKEVKPYFLFNSTDERALVDDPQCELKMYRLQLEHAERMISDPVYKVSYLMKLHTTRRELLMRHLALTNRPTLGGDPVAAPQGGGPVAVPQNNQATIVAIVVVQLWPQPTKTTKGVRIEKEVLFRADQCLTDLRDQFKCQRDYGVPMDLSENPDQAERIFRGELFKSGFFLIGDTFYNDMRDSNNTDLSANIIDWASKDVAKVSRGLGPFNRAKMEEKRFEDLEFRLGCPYLYLHQGDCEHLFTVSDIRYVPNDLKLKQTSFPFVTATSIGRKADNLRCYMCKNRPPHWYTRHNGRLPIDPYFFCENCFYSFNYDKDKRKIGQFQAYLYTSAFGIPDSVVMAVNKQQE